MFRCDENHIFSRNGSAYKRSFRAGGLFLSNLASCKVEHGVESSQIVDPLVLGVHWNHGLRKNKRFWVRFSVKRLHFWVIPHTIHETSRELQHFFVQVTFWKISINIDSLGILELCTHTPPKFNSSPLKNGIPSYWVLVTFQGLLLLNFGVVTCFLLQKPPTLMFFEGSLPERPWWCFSHRRDEVLRGWNLFAENPTKPAEMWGHETTNYLLSRGNNYQQLEVIHLRYLQHFATM